MEILCLIAVIGAFLFCPEFRENVKRTTKNANKALETANDMLEAGLSEIEASLPKAEIKSNSLTASRQEILSSVQYSENKKTTEASKETKEHVNGFWIALFITLGIGAYVYFYFETSKATTKKIQENTTIQENNTPESARVKPKKTEIRPKSTVWVGIIYLDTKKRVSMMLNAPLEIDTSREQTILTGHGMLELGFNGKTSSYHSAKRMRFYVNKEGQIQIINQAEYNRYNGDLRW